MKPVGESELSPHALSVSGGLVIAGQAFGAACAGRAHLIRSVVQMENEFRWVTPSVTLGNASTSDPSMIRG